MATTPARPTPYSAFKAKNPAVPGRFSPSRATYVAQERAAWGPSVRVERDRSRRAGQSAPGGHDAPGSDEEFSLEDCLIALASPNRLELVRLLAEPKPLEAIELHPVSEDERLDHDRVLTRQAVRHHLDRLIDAGLVKRVDAPPGSGRSRQAFVREEAAVHAVAMLLDGLVDPTGSPGCPARPLGEIERMCPHLVLVGVSPEPLAFQLTRAGRDPPRGWVIGSRPGVAVHLSTDPNVSAEHAELIPMEDGFELLDLRVADGGTYVNGIRLERGESQRVAHGDILGVSKTQLVFQDPNPSASTR